MADSRDAALGLGERLRSARKARAMTLEQAAFAIRLEASVLRALEDERFDELGASVFVRGHLKAYARLLGLSEEAVMAAYRAADPNADTPAKVTRELEQPLTTTPGPGAIALAVIAAIVALLLLYVLSGSKEPAGQSAGQSVGQSVGQSKPAPDSSQTVETVPTLERAPEPSPVPATGPSSPESSPESPPESSPELPSGQTETTTPAEVPPAATVEE